MSKKIILAGLIAVLCLPGAALAAQFRAEEQPSLGNDETISGNLYMVGGNVSSAGTVRGDLLVGGGNLIISSAVSNDVLAAGGSITITSSIGGDLRVGGGNITVQGSVAGDVVIGGGQVSVGGSGVGGDLAIGAGAVTITAPVGGNIKIGGGEVKIDAPVSGSVEIMAEKITLGPRAVIEGNFVYTSRDPAVMEEGAVVRGETEFTKSENQSAQPAAIGAFFTLALLGKFLMSLVGAFAVFLILPRFARAVVELAEQKPLENLGKGSVIFIVLPVASVILLFTVIGIPLGILGLLSFAAVMIFVSMVAPIIVGSVVHKWIWQPAGHEVSWMTILIGVLIYLIIGLIPFIGWIAKFAIMLITLGVVMSIKWESVKEWRK